MKNINEKRSYLPPKNINNKKIAVTLNKILRLCFQ